MLFLTLLACPPTKTTTTTTDTPGTTDECGTQYGTSDPECDITCGAGTYCALCIAAPDTSDTASESTVFACVPCGAAC